MTQRDAIQTLFGLVKRNSARISEMEETLRCLEESLKAVPSLARAYKEAEDSVDSQERRRVASEATRLIEDISGEVKDR